MSERVSAAWRLRVGTPSYREEVHDSDMGQVNVNPGGSTDGGFGAGMIIGIILLILIVLVLIFYAGPQIFSPGTTPRSFLDVLSIA
jgi:hypothetical protein